MLEKLTMNKVVKTDKALSGRAAVQDKDHRSQPAIGILSHPHPPRHSYLSS